MVPSEVKLQGIRGSQRGVSDPKGVSGSSKCFFYLGGVSGSLNSVFSSPKCVSGADIGVYDPRDITGSP